jgi:myo-inositol-1(or 4)-monophosphatase
MVVSMGDFSKRDGHRAALQMKITESLRHRVAKIRMWGAACVDFCYAATGKISAHIMFSGDIWDIAPGLIIASEAGCVIYAPDGSEPDLYNGRGVIASGSRELADLIIEEVKYASLH